MHSLCLLVPTEVVVVVVVVDGIETMVP